MGEKKKKEKLEEIELLDEMLSALVEVLEEKGFITQKEWEKKIKEKIERKTSLKPFRDL